jgi:AraC-like DNA-binding protein
VSDAMHSFCPVLHKSPRVRLRAAGPYQASAGNDMPFHCHETWELIYYRHGAIESVVGSEVFSGEPGVVVAIPPRVAHAELAHTAYANFWIQLTAPVNQPWPRICFDDEHAMFGHVCGSLAREWVSRSHCRDEMLELLTAELDVLLQRSLEQTMVSSDELLVRKAQRIMQERFSGGIRISDIALELRISTSFLREIFVELRGQSPMSYLQSLKIERALGILRNSDVPLETIADSCGYDSASHLSRYIKRATGHSPGMLRSEKSYGIGQPGADHALVEIHPR